MGATMAKQRDMSKAEFRDACRRYGFRSDGFMGYYTLPCGISVSVLNAERQTRRAWLAFLIREESKLSKKYGKKEQG